MSVSDQFIHMIQLDNVLFVDARVLVWVSFLMLDELTNTLTFFVEES